MFVFLFLCVILNKSIKKIKIKGELMKSDLFRKETVDKITGPEELNAYVKVLNPRIWFILIGIGIALIGLIFFVASTGFPVWDLFFGHTRNLMG